MSWPWSELGLSGPADLTEIRRAYALRLKEAHPEEDPEAFQRLHSAYQTACRMARQRKRQDAPPRRPAEEEPYRFMEQGEAESGWNDGRPVIKETSPKETSGEKPSQEEDWDYDELLKQKKAPRETPKEDQGEDWNYEELLKKEGAPKERPLPERRQDPDWDYDELLEEEAPPEEPKREAPKAPQTDWDYERLFAEGAAEAESARRRKLEELRRKNQERYKAQEQDQRRRAEDEEAAWSAVMAATHALELLHSTSAPVSEWRRFLESSVFWNVKANLDFIFALEDFLEQTASYLPQEIKAAIFSAFGFEKGPGNGEYQRLYRLLGGGKRARKQARRKMPLFRPGTKRWVKVLAFVWMAFIFITGTWGFLTSFFRDGSVPWVEQCQTWLEEDWGREFLRPFPGKQFRYHADKDGEDVREACVYAPAGNPDWYFFAFEDGDRDEKDPEASPGYGSNFTERMVMGWLDEFAREHGLGLDYDSAGGGFNATLGETPGAYLLQLPLTGAGDDITALGNLLNGLREQSWYQKEPPEFEVFLCYGNVNFYSCLSTEQDFDADYARAIYETKWGGNVCRHIAEETGAAAESLGEGRYVLIEQGTVTLEGETFFWVSALEKPPESGVLAHYLLSQDGTKLYCIPAEWLERTDLAFAVLRWGEPETRTVEDLGEHGEIRVWNHVK